MPGHGSNESQMRFGAGEDPALAELLAAIDAVSGDMDTAAISVDDRTAVLRAAGSFGAKMGDKYVGGEEAALADDSDVDGDAMRGGV